jgi:hypothetical protein
MCQETKARVRGPIHARPEIDSGVRVPVIAVDAVRRIASGPRNRTTASLALPARHSRDSNSTEPRPSAAWFSRLARNPKMVSRGAGISLVAASSCRAPNRVKTRGSRARVASSREPLSAGAGPRLPLDAAVRASTGSAPDRRRQVVRTPIRCLAGLVPNTSASTSAERRCKKDGDEDHGDDSGAGDEQSAIHGYLLRFVRR